MKIKDNMTVLFIGDSITDAGRTNTDNPAEAMGGGYPKYVSALINAMNPRKTIKYVNRGISGNRVKDLKARWQEDCIDIKPDVVSILIGINDTWRRYNGNDPTSTEDFENTYCEIMAQLREKLPETEIVILEPFLLPAPDKENWREDLDPKIHAVRRVARKFKAKFIPLDGMFALAQIKKPDDFWSPDGVHPNDNGSAFIAKYWIDMMVEE